MIIEKNPNPTKDQHFMVDKNMLEKIYETANIQDGEYIVEIGGGEGALTDYLVLGNNFVTVIEKDPYYADYLKKKYTKYPNLRVIEGDALTYNFCDYDRIIANLPYTITEPFLINLASSGALDYNPSNPKGSSVKSVTLVLSQNSVRKIVAPVQITEGKSRHINPEFGIMSTIAKTFCNVDIVSAIPSEVFYPKPAVTSFLVNFTPKKEKTTVDRIMKELLVDKKGNRSSIKRLYQLMISQGKIYKINKHKNNTFNVISKNFISSAIENNNIYDLSPSQISQLVQDFIRNDIDFKSKNRRKQRNREDFIDFSRYSINEKFIYDELDDEYEDETDDLNYYKSKFQKKYDYMYDDKQYNVLLHRGLEYIDSENLQQMLGKEHKKEKKLVLTRE